MIPYDIDPSLHDHEPGSAVLDDGFSPPVPRPQPGHDRDDGGGAGRAAGPRRFAR